MQTLRERNRERCKEMVSQPKAILNILLYQRRFERFSSRTRGNEMKLFDKQGIDYGGMTHYSLEIVREDGVLCWRTEKKKKGSKETRITSVNPFPRWWHRVRWFGTKNYYTLTKRSFMLCQGCGEGVSKWRIRNPNQGHGREMYNCCDSCVMFYDARWSMKHITCWKNGKTVLKPLAEVSS